MFDTSGPRFLCGDCGGLPVLVVGSTLQADNGRKRSDENQKLTSKIYQFTMPILVGRIIHCSKFIFLRQFMVNILKK